MSSIFTVSIRGGVLQPFKFFTVAGFEFVVCTDVDGGHKFGSCGGSCHDCGVRLHFLKVLFCGESCVSSSTDLIVYVRLFILRRKL